MIAFIILLAIGVVALLLLAGHRVLRGDDRSVRHYHETLRGLHDASDAGARASGRVADGLPAGSRGRRFGRGGSKDALLSRAARPNRPIRPTGTGPDTSRGPIAGLAALNRPSRRRRRRTRIAVRIGVAVAGAVAVGGLVVGAVLVVSAIDSGGSHHPAAGSLQDDSNTPAPTTVRSVAAPTSATSLPTLTATSTGPGTASYTVTSTHVALSLSVTEACWVEVRSGSDTGTTLYSGTMKAGAQQSFDGTAGLWLRLGFPPGVSVSVDGTRLQLPTTTAGAPLDVSVVSA